ncbi:hypothetical protein CC79DRAFT_1331533 [Sarocladium strictum]
MVNTYVVAPNFAIAPPPLIPRATAQKSLTACTASAAPVSAAPAYSESATNMPALLPLDSPYSGTVPLQLGDVLVDPFGAEWRPVNRHSRTVIDSDHIETCSKFNGFRETRENLLQGRLGVMASLLAALNLGADINISLYWQSKSHEMIEVKTLETHTFDATDGYIKKLLVSRGVRDHLEKYPKDNLYLVSGLKVAKGAKQSIDQSKAAGTDIAAGAASKDIADVKALKLAWKRCNRRGFKTASDFVMAVQLRRVKLDNKGELVDHYLSLRKATMEDGTPAAKDSDQGRPPVYAGLDDDLSPEKKIFLKDLHEMDGKDSEEAHDHVFLPDLSDDDDNE